MATRLGSARPSQQHEVYVEDDIPAPHKVQFKGEIIDVKHASEAAPAIARLLSTCQTHQLKDVDPMKLLGLDPGWDDEDDEAEGYHPTHYVGFDMEWQPETVPGQSNPIALIQLASDSVCLLFHMAKLHNRLPRALENLLLNPMVLKVGLGIKNDLRKLYAQFRIVPKEILDVVNMARKWDCTHTSLRGLAFEFLNWEVSKEQASSDWTRDPLTPAQRLYAATDAYVTLKLCLQLEAIDEDMGDPPYSLYSLKNDEVNVAALGGTDFGLEEIVQGLRRDMSEFEFKASETKRKLKKRIAALEEENSKVKDELARLRQLVQQPPTQARGGQQVSQDASVAKEIPLPPADIAHYYISATEAFVHTNRARNSNTNSERGQDGTQHGGGRRAPQRKNNRSGGGRGSNHHKKNQL